MNIAQSGKEYRTTKSLVYSCQYHVIWCTKYRRNALINGIDIRLKDLIVLKQLDYDYHCLECEVMPDHVHVLLDVNPEVGIIKVVRNIKGFTSYTLRTEFPELKTKLPTLWTRSKFISTVGAISLEVVKKYIENQKGK